MLAYDRILNALGLVGFSAFGEAPEAEAAAMAVRVLNALLGEWSSKPYMNPRQFVGTFVSTGAASLSLGPGGDITTNPVQINAVQCELGPTVWPQRLRTLEEYFRIVTKTTVGVPQLAAWDFQAPTSNLYFWPRPTPGYTVRVIGMDAIPAVANAQDTIVLPDWYAEAVDYCLALRLLPYLPGLTDPNMLPVLQAGASAAVSAIKARNTKMRMPRLRPDFGRRSGQGEYMTWPGRTA